MTENIHNVQPNIYKPAIMKIVARHDEAPGVRTLRLEFQNPADHDSFMETYRTGMFGLYGVYGEGESTFCVASPETRKEYIECTFRQSGRVTSALANADIGDLITFRGPYGNRFPIEEFHGKNLLFISGGIALPPTRSVIWSCLDQREKFGKVTIVYGARTVADLVYKHELEEWLERSDVELVLTVDPGGESPDWKHRIGFVPTVLEEAAPSPDNCIAVICGPPIMIKFTLISLKKLGFDEANVYTSLVGYGALDRKFPAGAFVEVEQLLKIQEAIARPEAPFLRWTTSCGNPALFSIKPPSALPAGTFTDRLWHYGVSELFIAHPTSDSRYLEFEITPEGHWVALCFESPRKRAKGYETLSPEPWRGQLHMVDSEGCFGMEFSYQLLQPFISDGIIALQCCASTGRGEHALFPWWEASHSPADFHQPAHFYHISLL